MTHSFTKHYIGISCGFHDAAVSVIDSAGNIQYAAHGERYTKIKHDRNLNDAMLDEAMSHISGNYQVHYYERPLIKYLRRLWAGESPDLSTISTKGVINSDRFIGHKIHTHNHHLSHAAAGFQTSPYNDATVVVIDAIGEFDTATIWSACYNTDGQVKYKLLWRQRYPKSVGLFYSAMTKRVGLKPLDEEYILMGMAAYGHPFYVDDMKKALDNNLHIGVGDDFLASANDYDIAASAQVLVEELICDIINKAKLLGISDNLVYGGGVALNCSANRLLGNYYDNIWILPNPGDAGSSLGAAALGFGKQINWNNSYLGHNIPGEYPIDSIIEHLEKDKIVGVANGRSEWGPRSLGNRSLLADPRGDDIKDKVNDIKKRQKFRPFAPVILEEHVNQYFDMPNGWNNSRYMQVIATCKFPAKFPAITHYDGTSRVQTVPSDGSGIRRLLESWYNKTGCPMLLNTSLNVRGEPMVNDIGDAKRFEKIYGVAVLS